MFIVKFTGGIGNQLFQYSFLVWLYKNYPSADIRYDISEYKKTKDHGGFFLPIKKFKKTNRYNKNKFRIISDMNFDSSFSDSDNIIFDGYWQKKEVVLNSGNIFTDLFPDKICTGQNLVYQKMIEKAETSVSLHIRRGDYNNHFLLGNIATKEYFMNAIDEIHKKVKAPVFFVFSDDIEWVKENICFATDKVTYITGNTKENVIYDMLLMSYCKYHIISNSSFSWWAQWIDNKFTRYVIAPSYWVNRPCPSFIYPVADIQMPYFISVPNIMIKQNSNKRPYFSIVVPVYNLEKSIRFTLGSLLNQTYQNIEVIAVNDCSTDDTGKILDAYARLNKNLVVIHNKKNQGVHCARMKGVHTATGIYILLVDGDDSLILNACEILYSQINGGDCDVYEYGYIRQPNNNIQLPPRDNRERIAALLDLENTYSPTVWNKVYKAQLLKNAFSHMDSFYTNAAEDIYESIVIAHHTENYGIIDYALYNYNVGEGISTKKQTLNTNIKYFSLMQTVIQKTRIFLEQNAPDYMHKITGLEKHLANDALYWFIEGNTEAEDIVPSLLALPAYFSTEALLPYFTKLKQNAENYEKGKININKVHVYYTKKILSERVVNKLKSLYRRLFKHG